MKIGFLSMPLTGHLHPMTALGRKMQARGHEVIFFGLLDAARIVHSAGLDFVPFGEEEYPVGTTPAMYARLAMLKGEDVVRHSFQEMHPQRARITLEQLPEKLIHRGVEALVLDTIHFFAELVPMNMGIPYAHIWNVLHIDSSGATPPCLFGVVDPRERLAALLRAYANFAANNPETYRLSFMEDPKFTEEMFRSAPLEREGGPGRQAFAAVVKALRDLKQSGKVGRSEDENLLAEVLWTGVHGVVSLKLIYPAFPTNSTEVLVNKMIQTLLNGLR